MRRFAQAVFGLATDIVDFIVVIMIGGVGAVIGFVIGLIIFGLLGLEGWFLAVPALIVAAVGFALGALLAWGFFATIDDLIGAVVHRVRGDQNDQQ